MTRIELQDFDARQLRTALPKLIAVLEIHRDPLTEAELQAFYELKDALEQAH